MLDSTMGNKRRLALPPLRVGGSFVVKLPDGQEELYRCTDDASRAQSVADIEAVLRKELETTKRAWVSELCAAAKSEAAAFGHVPLMLSGIREPCIALLLADAIARSTLVFCVLDRCVCSSVSIDFDGERYVFVLRARAGVMAGFLGSSEFISQEYIPGNDKNVVVADRYYHTPLLRDYLCFRNDRDNKSPMRLCFRRGVLDAFKVTGSMFVRVSSLLASPSLFSETQAF
jgi:hypothetical protein